VVVPALLGVGTNTALEGPATPVADCPTDLAQAGVAGEWDAPRWDAHADVVHTGSTHGTFIAAVERSPAAVPDLAAVVVATVRDADLHRLAIGFGEIAESILAILIEWTGSLAFQGAAAAVADLATDDRAVVTSVGFAD
jgi:hypothetical protein